MQWRAGGIGLRTDSRREVITVHIMAIEVDYEAKVNELMQRMDGGTSVLVVTHDYPDPDCLASAFGITKLLETKGLGTSIIAFGGFVGRAENRAMIRFLDIETIPLMLAEPADYDRVVLVDTFPNMGNLSLPPNMRIDAVLDHHPHVAGPDVPFLHDIRADLGATSTLVTKYLEAAKCPLEPDIATALFYGIKTDTNEMARNSSPEDLDCYKMLFDLIDHHVLAQIESPDRDSEYFRVLHRATEAMVTYGHFGYTHLGSVSTPDHIAEIADLFHSLSGIDFMVCSGMFRNHIFFSVRATEGKNAGEKAHKIAKSLGGEGGGHSSMAAGRIPVDGETVDRKTTEFRKVALAAFGVSKQVPKPLLEIGPRK